jgi:hypothetical protein
MGNIVWLAQQELSLMQRNANATTALTDSREITQAMHVFQDFDENDNVQVVFW